MSTLDNYIKTIDLGHPPLPPRQVEEALNALLSQIRSSSTLRVIKIVHGYGSHGRGGATKETVRDWAYRFRHRLRAVIFGEDYNIFNAETQEMREECGQVEDFDLDRSNPGITILWIK